MIMMNEALNEGTNGYGIDTYAKAGSLGTRLLN